MTVDRRPILPTTAIDIRRRMIDQGDARKMINFTHVNNPFPRSRQTRLQNVGRSTVHHQNRLSP